MGINPAPAENPQLPISREFFLGKCEHDRAIYKAPGGGHDVAFSRKTGRVLSGAEFNNKQVAYTVLRIPLREFWMSPDLFFSEIYLSIHREFLGYAQDRYDLASLPEVSTSDMVRIPVMLFTV